MRNQTTQIVDISKARFIDATCKTLVSVEMSPAAITSRVANPAHPSE
jgi:hypothetical protein